MPGVDGPNQVMSDPATPVEGAPGSSSDSVRRGVRLGIAAYTLWGFLTIYWKELAAFDAVELIGWRIVCAAVSMAVIVSIRRTWPAIVRSFRDRRVLGRIALAGVLLTVNWGSYIYAVVSDQVIETALGYFIAPLVTMAIGVFVLGERADSAQRIAFGCATIAVAILTVSYGRPPWIAIVLAASWSAYGLATRQISLGPVESLAGETFVLVLPAIALLVAVSGRSGSVVDSASGRDLAFVAGTGIVTAVPLMLFAGAAKAVPFVVLGPLNLLVPVINFGLGWAIYDEPMPPIRLIGFGFVWLALAVVMWDRIARARRQRLALLPV
jgi:chloramphenicol-sensitive protein RarD